MKAESLKASNKDGVCYWTYCSFIIYPFCLWTRELF